ncbi:hypothetical protein BJ973_004983 [Actinoplanes tereljensis]|uniref:Uncharacterized protein n=1 Tax=Paractinoplanes tereljensis TaxID=571912 RepID=A0A919NPN0_9ACTN|nr:hypothetical protein [Actinoplanes tereljensis]GIF21572.1 hypothetical protein Ate02nite_43020 [Actinoplanes tereljensis]
MTDDDLRNRLRRTDPAASLAPLPPDRVSRLLEESMSADVVALPARRRLLPVLAAAAVLLLAGAGWLVFRPSSSPTPTLPTAAPVHLAAPAGGQAKCREPQAATLAENADFAFAGTVTGIGDLVTLQVSKVYKGAAASTVQVEQQGDSSETLMGSGKFETGKSYLVAASAGTVLICGYSGEADAPGLLALYEQAF